MENRNRRFINNIWIMGEYCNQNILGRTTIYKGSECVSFVSETGRCKMVLFSAITGMKKLSFTEKKKPEITSTIKINNNHSVVNNLIIDVLKEINNN